MSAKLGLGLPNLTHVLEAVILLNRVFFFDAFCLPLVRRCVELRTCKLWFSHSSSLQITYFAVHQALGRHDRWTGRAVHELCCHLRGEHHGSTSWFEDGRCRL